MMGNIYCVMKARLLDKEVMTTSNEKISVFGLASMNVRPRREGLGRLLLKLFKKFAKQKGKVAVIGFPDDKSIGFYLKCGWFICGEFDGLKAVSSIPLQIIFEEKW